MPTEKTITQHIESIIYKHQSNGLKLEKIVLSRDKANQLYDEVIKNYQKIAELTDDKDEEIEVKAIIEHGKVAFYMGVPIYAEPELSACIVIYLR